MRNTNSSDFSTYCPVCGGRITASGRTSEVIHHEKEKHLIENHDSEELFSYYLAKRIADDDR